MKLSMVGHSPRMPRRYQRSSRRAIEMISKFFISEGVTIRPQPTTRDLPQDWYRYHHRNCGTLYRGCDHERCPKDVYERTGRWIG